jgi:hypothetical protein
MPKPSTFPTLYDEALQLDLTSLKRLGYLQPDEIRSGGITWYSRGARTGSIGLYSNTIVAQPYLRLNFKHNGKKIDYIINIESVPSNLGRSNLQYLVCPQTGKRCRKLYLIGDKFLHREAYIGCLYSSQIRSKKKRYWDNTIGAYFDADDILEQLHKKHAKKRYAGRPTKKYLRLSKKLEQSERITSNDINRFFSI